MEKLNLELKNLRKFGITMGVVFFVITLLMAIRHKHSLWPTSVISAIFFILAYFASSFLKYIYVFWMRLAFLLSWINTRLILFIIFYLVFTPIGLVIKLLRFDLLGRKIDKNKKSYWANKEKNIYSDLSYERQF